VGGEKKTPGQSRRCKERAKVRGWSRTRESTPRGTRILPHVPAHRRTRVRKRDEALANAHHMTRRKSETLEERVQGKDGKKNVTLHQEIGKRGFVGGRTGA